MLVHLLRHAYFMPKGFEDIQILSQGIVLSDFSSDVAALLRSHMIGLLPFESTIEQTTETMPLALKTKTAATMIKQKQLTTAATILDFSGLPIERNPFFKALFCGIDFNYSINTFHSLVLLSSKRNLHLKQHKTRQKEAQ